MTISYFCRTYHKEKELKKLIYKKKNSYSQLLKIVRIIQIAWDMIVGQCK